MNTNEQITLRRDCEAVEIPYGDKVMLPAGTVVMLTQALGGTYTVMTDRGQLVRIAGKDADAIGQENPATSQTGVSAAPGGPDVEELVWAQLRSTFDPEIPVNIVDLGLVYLCRVTPSPQGGNKVEVKFTLTAPGCGMGGVLKGEIENKVWSLPGIEDVEVEVVVDPPWDPSMMSEAAKLELGFI
jgi:probable FeS assembly SUF system protein SufT